MDINPAAVTPTNMLASYDKFMSGRELTIVERAIVDRVTKAGAFAAQAYHMAIDHDQGAHALTRAFICAMITPLHPDLDYLRAQPEAGQAARDSQRDAPHG